jgi:hypothetical protein
MQDTIFLYIFAFHTLFWEDNIKMDLREIGWLGMDWIHLAQDRV